jgi:ribosomal protein L12E/L44/L45/RPP1/RPP2
LANWLLGSRQSTLCQNAFHSHKEQHDEACATYVAFILHDAGADITADALQTLVTAPGSEIEPYWCPLFSGLLAKEGVDMTELVLSSCKVGGGGESGGIVGGAEGEVAGEEKVVDDEEEVESWRRRSLFVLR